jgi:hypothetical protein
MDLLYRLRFIVRLLSGDGLYPILEEFAGQVRQPDLQTEHRHDSYLGARVVVVGDVSRYCLARDRRDATALIKLRRAATCSGYGSAPRRRETPVEEDSTRKIVDRSGS